MVIDPIIRNQNSNLERRGEKKQSTLVFTGIWRQTFQHKNDAAKRKFLASS